MAEFGRSGADLSGKSWRSKVSDNSRRRSWVLASTLALSLAAAVAGVYLTLDHFDLSLRQLVVKGAEHFGWPTEDLKPLVASSPRFADRPLDDRIHGSHHILAKDGKAVPVPVHGSRDLGAGLLAAIQRQSGVKLK